jgi:hypothetical protein
LLDRCSTTWVTSPALLALVILDIGFHFFAQTGLTAVLQFYTSHLLQEWETHTTIFSFFLLRWGCCELFCPTGLELQSSWSQPPA